MKILYVTDGISPYVVGGMQAVSRRQITGLADGKSDVVYIHSFRGKPQVRSDLPGEQHIIDYPHSRGLSKWSLWHYPNELKAYSRLVETIAKRVNPDVIYSEGPLVYQTLMRKNRPPVVFHPHGLDMYQDQMNVIDRKSVV